VPLIEETSDTKPDSPYHAMLGGYQRVFLTAAILPSSLRISMLHIATVFAFRGEADRAFEWMEKAAEQHDPDLGSIIAHRMFDTLHDDPRWLAFLRENGLAPEQLAAIKFDVTVPK
jgi:hypothetical protein